MRWLGYPLEMPLNTMLAPGAVGILRYVRLEEDYLGPEMMLTRLASSYKNNSIDEPAFNLGMSIPTED